jgi:hypothetical protein
VTAPEIEKLMVDGVRHHFAAREVAKHAPALDDCDLIEPHVDRIVVKPEAIGVRVPAPHDERTTTNGTNHRASALPTADAVGAKHASLLPRLSTRFTREPLPPARLRLGHAEIGKS